MLFKKQRILIFLVFLSFLAIGLVVYSKIPSTTPDRIPNNLEINVMTEGIYFLKTEDKISYTTYTKQDEKPTTKAEKSTESQKEIRRPTLKQKCTVPTLNPFHPDVLKFTKKEEEEESLKQICDYQWYSDVSDEGLLYIKQNKKKSVKKAQFGYIVRIDKNRQKVSQLQIFFEDSKHGNVLITQDYVKVVITLKGGQFIHEAHMYPVRNFTRHPPKQQESSTERKPDKLNVIFINVDSLSHSAAVRSLPNFYKTIKNDRDSITMKGHTVVGDGTTSQFTAILIGDSEANLPEARKHFPNSGSVDRWPFIFKDYNQRGFATVYSEDSPATEAFTYRLNGFDTKPTERYLRLFWRGASNFLRKLYKISPRCHHQMELRFLRRLLMNYKDIPIFSFFAMGSAHSTYANFKLFDQDFLDFHNFLDSSNTRENSLVVWFGDHGARSSSYRATMVGKLEERLPFMLFSFPRWFKNKHFQQFQHFQRNANIMTSHFDIFSTLTHMLTNFDTSFKNDHKRGKSLFTDISKLNRTCQDAGVMEHWCPCIQYEPIGTESKLSNTLASKLIEIIKHKLYSLGNAKKLCERVRLSQIRRVQRIKTNDHVRQFAGSFRKGCDGCGIRLQEDKKYTSDSYEVVLQTRRPNSALFEATLVRNVRTGGITVNGEISRINKYGSQPHCIADKFPHLRPFCYCKQQIS